VFIWCTVLFGLGIMAFMDSIFNMGEIFRQVNSVLFMLISVGLLIRTTTKAKAKKTETNEKRVFELERQVNALRAGERKLQEH
jgi:hypothetical protein